MLQTYPRVMNQFDLAALCAFLAAIALILCGAIGHTGWYLYNDHQLTQAARVSPDYQNCAAYFAEHIADDYTHLTRNHCLRRAKWHLQQERQYFTHRSWLKETRYATTQARREAILKGRTDYINGWNELQTSPWWN